MSGEIEKLVRLIKQRTRKGVYDFDDRPEIIDGAAAALRSAQEEIERLTEALRPFADEANTWAEHVPDAARAHVEFRSVGSLVPRFTMGDLRRARALLTKETGTDDA